MMQKQRHRALVEEQDEYLEEIDQVAKNLKMHAEDIDVELKK